MILKNIKIRQAKKEDIIDIGNLTKYLMKVEEVDNINEQTRLILRQRILPTFDKRNNNKVIIAEIDKKIIGYVLVETVNKLVASMVYIVVSPIFQKKGIGKKLIKGAEDYLKKKRIKILQATIHKDNKKSKKFHEKMGFDFFGFIMRRQIK
ncbi:GNAT family N-acetyltransferase [Candidatus Wolfebacteria bacterium]|nr:GNAT family N-acetyltransferase [Candidatus Wolfebacteria bacterium]